MERCEIVVIGGGVIGTATARALRMRGRDVYLIERGMPGAESTAAAAGILGALSETDLDDMARLGCSSVSRYDGLIHDLCEANGLSIDYWKEGTIWLARTAVEVAALGLRRARAERLGAAAVPLDRHQLRRLEPALVDRPDRVALLFADEGRVDGGALSLALFSDFLRRGGRARTKCALRRVVLRGDRVEGVDTEMGAISCDAIVDAAGAWSGDFDGAPQIPVEPLRGQMVCLRAPKPVFRHTIYSDAVYAASRRDGRLLLGSTRERVGYRKEVTAAGVQAILARAFELCRSIRTTPVGGWWSGLRPLSRDGLPLVGFWPGLQGYMVAGGHGANGILLAPLTADLVADGFDGRSSAEATLLDPARLTVSDATA